MSPLAPLQAVLAGIPRRVVACSGGVDSLVLATVASRMDPAATVVAHTVTPAVPAEGTARVVRYASKEGWRLELVRSGELDDENYLANPTDRCYHCKTSLYQALRELAPSLGDGVTMLSGANTDDLGEYRPGLQAAAEHGVRHPYLEAGIDKAGIRAMARHLGLDAAELPASPCLASRLYTGTPISAPKLRAVEVGEATLRQLTGIRVARCRIRDDDVLIEVPDEARPLITGQVLAAVGTAMRAAAPTLAEPVLDPRPYQAGQAILGVG
jgi:uncharacterized protein